MRILLTLTLLTASLISYAQYFPERGEWETKTPKEAGFNADKLQKAVDFAKANEYSGPVDLRVAILQGFRREPLHEIAGPTKKRGGPAGMIIKDGYLVASWGETDRVDMTFSVTKSYLSTMAGLAWDEGLIQSTDDKMTEYVWDGKFMGRHNGKITWHHLLNQSSDWSGDLFGMYDWNDRPPREGDTDDWRMREFYEPGTNFEYNDVRVNLLAYSLLQVWRKPLPQVLKEKIMDPIDASTTWRWFGYDHAWVNVDGTKVQSVTGGGHSGGGIFISAEDHARFGLLFMNDGKWNGKQLISKDWITKARQSSEASERYGYMWWLNKGPRKWEGFGEHVYYASGFGGNNIVIDDENGLVCVFRWLNPPQLAEMMGLIADAMK